MESVSSAQTIEKGLLLLGKMLLTGNMRVMEARAIKGIHIVGVSVRN